MNFLKNLVFIILLFFPIANCFAGMVTSVQNETFDDNGSRELRGIAFNEDGTKLFTSYQFKAEIGGVEEATYKLNEYNLSTPYDISTRTYAGNDERCELNSKSDGSGNGPSTDRVFDIEFSNDGMKVFVVEGTRANDTDDDKVFRFDLTSPYDISTCFYVSKTTNLDSIALQNGSNAGSRGTNVNANNKRENRVQGIEFNETGTKLFLIFHGQSTFLEADGGGPRPTRLLEYTLSTPYDITDLTLVTTAGIELEDEVNNPQTMRFSANGKRIFIVDHLGNANGREVHQISLSNPYDTSSFTIDGRVRVEDLDSDHDEPGGIAFSKSGLKMYVGDDGTQSIYEFDLVCPFNIIAGKCPPITENKDRTGIAEAQIDLAKRTMEYATDSALNRLRWIRRNKEKQNLTNHNINFDFSNPVMAKLAQKISTSNTEDKQEKNQDVFYWSEGSISLGKIGDSSISSSKEISTDALTFGFDKFNDEKSLSGFAFRLGKNDTDVGSLGSNLDTDTYNLTFYNTSSKDDDTKFIDTILGVGKLNYDILTVLDNKNLTAEREGYQLYGTIRVKDEIKKDNLMLVPSVQLDLGRSFLGSYIESSGAGAISVDNQDVRTNKLRAALSLVEDLSKDDYVFKKHGKFEYSADLARSSNFKYFYVSDPNSRFSEKLSSGALHNLSGELGLDMVLKNNFSIFLIYEREQAIGYGHIDQIHIALGYLPENKMNYALKVDAKDDLRSKVLISKKIGDYKLSFDHSHDFLGEGDNYLSSINLSKDF